ncbi:hypothetical protein N9Y97_06720 [Pseudomonadales bacterium]|nr:hypothetical protein [Pseudomonadales bacterium]
MKNQYDAYLFDLDGTLVDSAPDIGAALNKSLTLKTYLFIRRLYLLFL